MLNNRIKFILLQISYKFYLDFLYMEKLAVSLLRETITIWQVKI